MQPQAQRRVSPVPVSDRFPFSAFCFQLSLAREVFTLLHRAAFTISAFPLGRHLSCPLCQDGGMKFNRLAWLTQDTGETIATFGDARLVKMLNGKIELIARK